MKNKVLLILLIVVLNSCSNNKVREKIDCNLESKKDFMNSIKSIELLALENTETCYIGSESRLLKTKKDYFILDNENNKRVLRFDSSGKFLNKIGEDSKGYLKMNSVQINQDTVYCLVDKKKIFKYNKEGKFLGKKDIGILVDDFRKLDDKYYLYLGYGNSKYKSRLLITDNNLNIRDRLLNHESKMFHIEDTYIFSQDRNNFYLKEAFSSNILKIEKDSLTSYRSFDYGSYKIKDSFFESKDYMKELQTILGIGFCLTNKYFKSGKYELVSIYKQKIMKTTKILGFSDGKDWSWYSSKLNDIINLISDSIHYLDKKTIVGVIDAVDCLDLKDIFGEKVNIDAYNNLEEDSNSLIIKIHFK